MADTVTVSLSAEAIELLRRMAKDSGESVEAIAELLLEHAAADLTADGGDDEELRQRIAEWERTRESIPSEEVHAWLRSLHTDSPIPRPVPRPA